MSKPTKAFLRKQFAMAKKLYGPGTDYYDRRKKRQAAKKRKKRKQRKDNPAEFAPLSMEDFRKLRRLAMSLYDSAMRRLKAEGLDRDAVVQKMRDNREKLLVRAVYIMSNKNRELAQRFYTTLTTDSGEMPLSWIGMKEPNKVQFSVSKPEHMEMLHTYLEQLEGYYKAAQRGEPEWKDLSAMPFSLPSIQKMQALVGDAVDERATGVELIDEDDTMLILGEVMQILQTIVESVEGGEEADETTVVMERTANDIARYFGLDVSDDESLITMEEGERSARILSPPAETDYTDREISFELNEALEEGQRALMFSEQGQDLEAYMRKRHPDEVPYLARFAPERIPGSSVKVGDREVDGVFRFRLPFWPTKRVPRLAPIFSPSADRNAKDYYASPFSSDFGPREEGDSMRVTIVYMNRAFPALTSQMLEAEEEPDTDLFFIAASAQPIRGDERLRRIIYGKEQSEYADDLSPRKYTARYTDAAKAQLSEFRSMGDFPVTQLPFFKTLGATLMVIQDLVAKRMSYEKFAGEGTVRYVNPGVPRGHRGRRDNPSLLLPMAYALTSAVGLGASLYDLHQTIQANRRGV